MAGNNHGHTPAAWTGVIIVCIGFCVSGAFMVMAEPVGFVGGLVVIALGGVVGLVMRAAGLGQASRTRPAREVAEPQPQAAAEPQPQS